MTNRLTDLTEPPEKWMGRRITVEGYINHVYGPQMFTLQGVGDRAGGKANAEIPVVATEPISMLYDHPGRPAVRASDRIRITGTAMSFSRSAVEDLANQQFPEDVYRRFANHPMILAETIRVAGKEPPAAEGSPGRKGMEDLTALITHSHLTDKIGHWVRLREVKVLNLVSDRGFWVGEGRDHRLFAVLPPSPNKGSMEHLVPVKPGQPVTLIGVIEKMPSREEAARRWTTRDNSEAEALSKEPVYLQVRSIHILAQ